MMPDQSTPEIDRLERAAWNTLMPVEYDPRRGQALAVPLTLAVQAVRDTEQRVREEFFPLLSARAANPMLSSTNVIATNIEEDARREAFREAVDALREADDGLSMWSMIDAAELIERRFLSSGDGDKPEEGPRSFGAASQILAQIDREKAGDKPEETT